MDYILRLKLRKTVLEFTATSKSELSDMEAVARKTHCDGFTGIPNPNDKARGKVLSQWSFDHGFGVPCEAHYDIQWGAYKDTLWGILGNKGAVDKMVSETNAEATCWASVTAKAVHIGGSMWAAVFTDPYKD